MTATGFPRPSRPCPLCGGELAREPRETGSARKCRGCGGCWIAPQDLEAFLRRRAADMGISAGPPLHDAVPLASPGAIERPRTRSECPDCRQPMESFNYAYDSNVMLERCAEGHGVWLRAEHLRPLAEFVKGHEAIEPALEDARRERRERAERQDFRDQALYLASAFVPLAPIVMIPVDTDAPVQDSPAVVTWALILLNVLVYTIEPSHPGGGSIMRFFVFVPGLAWLMPWTIVTHQFLHESFLHLAFNMWFLWLFGRDVENKLGSDRYLKLYFASGLIAALGQTLLNWDFMGGLLGASGAISGVMGAYFLLFPGARLLMRTTVGRSHARVSSTLFLAIWFGENLWRGATGHHNHVAFFAHVAGFGAGYWLAATKGGR